MQGTASIIIIINLHAANTRLQTKPAKLSSFRESRQHKHTSIALDSRSSSFLLAESVKNYNEHNAHTLCMQQLTASTTNASCSNETVGSRAARWVMLSASPPHAATKAARMAGWSKGSLTQRNCVQRWSWPTTFSVQVLMGCFSCSLSLFLPTLVGRRLDIPET